MGEDASKRTYPEPTHGSPNLGLGRAPYFTDASGGFGNDNRLGVLDRRRVDQRPQLGFEHFEELHREATRKGEARGAGPGT